jgi:predicted RNase H-like nuclease (RuvC/YqgF family)
VDSIKSNTKNIQSNGKNVETLDENLENREKNTKKQDDKFAKVEEEFRENIIEIQNWSQNVVTAIEQLRDLVSNKSDEVNYLKNKIFKKYFLDVKYFLKKEIKK